MAIYPLALEGFENQMVEVQDDIVFGRQKLLVNGEPVPKGAEKGEMLLTRDDGQQVTARWQKSGLRRHTLEVDGKTVEVKRSALWWELLLVAIPIGLWRANVLGLVFVLVAFGLGRFALQTRRPALQRIVLWGGAMAVAVALNMAVGSLLPDVLR